MVNVPYYYSESKKGHLNLLEMPLDYLVRAFNKTLKKLNENFLKELTLDIKTYLTTYTKQ